MATIDGLFNSINAKLNAPVRTHLKSVYACLTMSILSAAVGAYTHMFTNLLRGGGIGFSLLGAGLVFGLFFTPDDGKNRVLRLAMLLGFAFFSGLGMGPLLDLAVQINEAIVPNSLFLSSMIFASFTGVSLFAPDGQYLFLGGTLMSGLSTLFWLGLINIFFESQLLFRVYIWSGLLLFCGFIVWDTQMIIEKKRRGDGDFIGHSLDLFIDFIQVFRRILILLMQKTDQTSKKEDDISNKKRHRD